MGGSNVTTWLQRALACLVLGTGLCLAVACDSGNDGDPGGEGGLPLDDTSAGDTGADVGAADTGGEGGTDTGGEGGTDTGGEGGTDTGGEGGTDTGGGDPPTTADVLAVLGTCKNCHGGPACSTGVCFLDDPQVLQDAPKANSFWCSKGESTNAACAANLMEAKQMPTGCSFSNTCATAGDIATVRDWIDAGFPD